MQVVGKDRLKVRTTWDSKVVGQGTVFEICEEERTEIHPHPVSLSLESLLVHCLQEPCGQQTHSHKLEERIYSAETSAGSLAEARPRVAQHF